MKFHIDHKLFIRIYGLLVIIGSFPVFSEIFGLLRVVIDPPIPIQVYQHIEPFFYPEKRSQIYAYIACVVFSSIYVLIVNQISKMVSQEGFNQKWVAASLAALSLIDLSMWSTHSLLCMALWSCFMAIPIASYSLFLFEKFLLGRLALVLVTSISFIVLGYMVSPLLFEAPRIESEYFNIPNTTYLNNDRTRAVDTAEFLNGHYNIGIVKSVPSSISNHGLYLSVHIELTQDLEDYLNSRHSIIASPIGGTKPNFESPFYDRDEGRLVATAAISPIEETCMLGLVSDKDQKSVSELASKSRVQSAQKSIYQYRQDEEDFIIHNKHEFISQILARRIIHHQNFVLGPIQEIDKGRTLSDINMQYGYLYILVLQKIMHVMGMVTYSSYFHLSFAFYPIYYVISALMVYYISRNILITSVYFCGSIGIQAVIGYDALITAPGMNPIRHFFDLAVLPLVFMYFKSKKCGLLIPIYFLSLISILNNSQTGLFLSVSVCGAIGFMQYTSNRGLRRIPIVPILISLLALGMALFLKIGKDELSTYYIAGLCGFPLHASILSSLFILSSIGYFTLYTFWQDIPQHLKYGILCLLFYCQTMFLYYVWGGTRFHFLNYASIYMLTGIVVMTQLMSNISELNRFKREIIAFALMGVISLLLVGVLFFWSQKKTYEDSMNAHENYAWDMPKAHIITTMPQKPFSDSADLIDKYSIQNGIYIISEYDNFLPFLADRYSAMPYPDLQWFINSDVEKNKVVACINSERPAYLFVDRNLDRTLGYEVMNPMTPIFGSLYDESVLRVHRIRVLQDIFHEVMSDYELIETSGLLSVWKRKI